MAGEKGKMAQPESMSEKEEMSRLAQIAQGYQQQAQFLQQQANAIQVGMNEINSALEALKNLKGTSTNEVLLPIGAGIYFHADIKDKDKVLTDIGASVIAEKNLEETMETLKKRFAGNEELMNKTQKSIVEIGQELQRIDAEAKKLLSKMKGSDVGSSEE